MSSIVWLLYEKKNIEIMDLKCAIDKPQVDYQFGYYIWTRKLIDQSHW